MTAFLALCWANRAAIGLAVLIGLAFAWHRDQVGDAVDVARAELRDEAKTQAMQAVLSAQSSWITNTSMLNSLAAVDDAAMVNRLASIDAALRTLKTEYRTHAIAAPLPAGCIADPDRVQRVNDARAH